MIAMFEKTRSQKKIQRVLESSDLVGGILFLSIMAFVIKQNPQFLLDIPLIGRIGLLLFLLTFIYFHVLSFKIRIQKRPLNPCIKDLLLFQSGQIRQRIGFLKNFKWLLIVGLGGLFVLFYSMSPTVSTGVYLVF